MDLQSTNRVKLGVTRETTFGQIPANPVMRTRRITSAALAANPQTERTAEIRSDRQVSDQILVGYQAGGQIGAEASFQALDYDLEEALQGTWTALAYILCVTADTEISDLSTTTITVASGGAAFKAGMLALTSGFATSGNNKVSRVSSSTGTTVVFPSSTFTAESAVPAGAAVRQVGFQGASGDIVATVTGGNALTSTSLDFTTLGLSAGMWIKIGGAAAGDQFATAANNDFARVSAVAANRLSLDRVPASWGADAGTGKTIAVYMGDFLINGSTKRSNTIERQYLDHSPVSYEYLTGQTVDKLGLTVEAQKIVTATIDYIGASASISTTRASGATDIAPATNDVLNAASNVGRIGFDSAAVTGPNYLMSAKVEYANNLRRQVAVGALGAIGIGNGEFDVTGTLNAYFGDKTMLDKILANTLTSLDFRIGRTDSNNESYVFDFPAIKLSSGSPSVSGKNADVMIEAGFQALRDATLGYTASVGRFWYLP